MKSAIALVLVFAAVATAGLLGGWNEVSANSDTARKAALIAELRVNEMSNSLQHKKTTRVLSVKTKVVAGIIYEVVLEVAQTGCPKFSNTADCVVAENAAREICTMQFLEQPWLTRGAPTGKMIKAKCVPKTL